MIDSSTHSKWQENPANRMTIVFRKFLLFRREFPPKMFRSVLKPVQLLHKHNLNPLKFQQFCTAELWQYEQKGLYTFYCWGYEDLAKIHQNSSFIHLNLNLEYNNVKLLGTIISEVRTLANGSKSLILRTNEDTNI